MFDTPSVNKPDMDPRYHIKREKGIINMYVHVNTENIIQNELYIRALLLHTGPYKNVPILKMCPSHAKRYTNTNVLQIYPNRWSPPFMYLDHQCHKSILFGPIPITSETNRYNFPYNFSTQFSLRIYCFSYCQTNPEHTFPLVTDRPMSISINVEDLYCNIYARKLIPFVCESSVKKWKTFHPVISKPNLLSKKNAEDLEVFVNIICGYAIQNNVSITCLHQLISRRMHCLVNRARPRPTKSPIMQ